MSKDAVPWYVRGVIGIGAWVTAVVLMLLGAAIMFALLEFDDPAALILIGAIYLSMGLWLLRESADRVFLQQLGIATSAAGAALLSGGFAATFEELWAGFIAAALVAGVIVAMTTDKILQFLVAALAVGFYFVALVEGKTPYFTDFAALATPCGLYLLLRPPQRDMAPTAIALVCAFPVVSVGIMEDAYWLRDIASGGTFARILHMVLFLLFVYLHWRKREDSRAKIQTAVFAALAVLVCLLLPPGGSAAMLLLMLAFVIGSAPFAVLGAALQGQFIVRYYYSLEMNLFDKSLLLMAVGALLIATWWFVYRGERPGGTS